MIFTPTSTKYDEAWSLLPSKTSNKFEKKTSLRNIPVEHQKKKPDSFCEEG